LLEILAAQTPKRPRIVGISQIALFTHDSDKSRAYYGNFLGLEELHPLKASDGPHSTMLFRINDRQYVELIPEQAEHTDRLSHISLQTDDIEALRRYLSSKDIAVPQHAHRDKLGILSFSVTDPEGHSIEMLQYTPHALILRTQEKSNGAKPISDRMAHAGLIVTNLPAEYSFYTDILGFKETYRGSMSGTALSWVNLRVPDGDDYIEFMLYKEALDPAHRGGAHHLCLQVQDVPSSVADLESRPYYRQYDHPMQIHLGVNRKRQVNLFDPDGTRLELMEPHTIDGKPEPSSTAPPP
jgi:lactoylglutathione lyase